MSSEVELVDGAAGAAAAPRVSAGTWRALAAFGLVLATGIALWPTTQTLLQRWADAVNRAYTHGALILPIVAYLLWRRRAALGSGAARPSWPAFGLTLLLGLGWVLAYRAGVQLAHQALLPLLCVSAAWTLYGAALLRRLLLPLGFLLFAVPVWDLFNPLLQWASVFGVRAMLSVVGIPVFFDGLMFQIPAGRFEIAGGCSGLHFFIVGIAIATLYGEISGDRLATRLKLIALVIACALLTNWIRIAVIILAGHYTDMQHYLVGEEHYSFGWGMFAVAMALYFLIVRRWPAPAQQAAAPAGDTPRALAPAGVALAAVALLAPALAVSLDANLATRAAAAPHVLPHALAGWQTHAADGRGAPGVPRLEQVDVAERRVYAAGGREVDAFAGVYLQQLQGKELAGYYNQPLGELRAASRTASARGWRETEALDAAGRRWLARVRYRVGVQAYVSLRRAQLAYALGSLAGDPVSSMTVLRTPCRPECAAARATLDELTTALDAAQSTQTGSGQEAP